MYERKPKGLQAIASAIASLRADFRAKDDARAAAMQELSQSETAVRGLARVETRRGGTAASVRPGMNQFLHNFEE